MRLVCGAMPMAGFACLTSNTLFRETSGLDGSSRSATGVVRATEKAMKHETVRPTENSWADSVLYPVRGLRTRWPAGSARTEGGLVPGFLHD